MTTGRHGSYMCSTVTQVIIFWVGECTVQAKLRCPLMEMPMQWADARHMKFNFTKKAPFGPCGVLVGVDLFHPMQEAGWILEFSLCADTNLDDLSDRYVFAPHEVTPSPCEHANAVG